MTQGDLPVHDSFSPCRLPADPGTAPPAGGRHLLPLHPVVLPVLLLQHHQVSSCFGCCLWLALLQCHVDALLTSWGCQEVTVTVLAEKRLEVCLAGQDRAACGWRLLHSGCALQKREPGGGTVMAGALERRSWLEARKGSFRTQRKWSCPSVPLGAHGMVRALGMWWKQRNLRSCEYSRV